MALSAWVGRVQSSVLLHKGSIINLLVKAVYGSLLKKSPLLEFTGRTAFQDGLTLLGKIYVRRGNGAIPFYV